MSTLMSIHHFFIFEHPICTNNIRLIIAIFYLHRTDSISIRRSMEIIQTNRNQSKINERNPDAFRRLFCDRSEEQREIYGSQTVILTRRRTRTRRQLARFMTNTDGLIFRLDYHHIRESIFTKVNIVHNNGDFRLFFVSL